ncbi:MAG: hypothetical protein V1891_01370 [bacterium]
MDKKLKGIFVLIFLLVLIVLMRYFQVSYKLIIGLGVLVILLLFIKRLFLLIRTYRMEKMARDFGLNFSGDKKLWKLWIINPQDKLNIIWGELNGNKIEIYDFVKYKWSDFNSIPYYDLCDHIIFRAGLTFRYSYSPMYTVCSFAKKKYEVKGILWMFPSIKFLKKWLKAISERIDYEPKYNPIVNNLKIFLFFIILIIIIFSILMFNLLMLK